MRITFACWIVLASCTAAPAGDNWPQFLGPTHDGHADATDLPLAWSESQNVAWKTPIHGRGWSSPVVWGDQVWLTTADEDGRRMYALCVDLATGRIVHDRLLFEPETLQITHAFNSYASPTPVVEQGRVYVHFGVYGTACLDTRSGETIWVRRDLECDHFRGPGSSPYLFGDLLILHFDGIDVQYLTALDKLTGRTVWRTDRSTEFGNLDPDFRKAYSTPIVIRAAGRLQMISTGAKATMSYDPRTGRELWKVRYDGFSNASRPVFAAGLVLVNTGFGKPDLWAVRPDGEGDVTDTHVVWRLRQGVPAKPTPVVIGDLVYMADDSGVASCVEAQTGEVVWRSRLDGDYSATPLVAAGRLYFFNESGAAKVLKPGRRFEVLATNRLDAGAMASPALTGRAMIVRTKTHLYRIEESR